MSEDEVRSIYEEMPRNEDIIEIKVLNSKNAAVTDEFLTGPVRGIMSVILVLAALAGAMYFLKDKAQGKYDWLSFRGKMAPAFASCFTASFFAGVAVCVSICVSPFSSGILRESLRMLLLLIASAGFALNFCVIFKSYGKLGAVIPCLMLALIILSPIFINLGSLKVFQLLIPTYYYLKIEFDKMYILYMLIYIIGVYLSAILLNYVFGRDDKKHFVI